MAEDTTLPIILNYRLGLQSRYLTNPVINLQALGLDVGMAVCQGYAERQTAL